MKLLVIGSGGREHALCWKLAQSRHTTKLYCAPGNAGIAEVAECVEIQAEEIDSLLKFARNEQIDLTVVGPEAPLCAGIVDLFRESSLRVFGPNKAAAQLEGSKAFTKQFLLKHKIPTAAAQICADAGVARTLLRKARFPVVIKADGLAAGKGVVIARSLGEAEGAIEQMMGERVFGRAGDQVLIEECLVGEETSMLALVDGKSFVTLPSSQDHKRVFDNDQGPNTGGMGAYSPAPVVTETLLKRIEGEVFHATVNGLAAEGIEYRGLLYAGIMVTTDGPKVLEFNVRFGDPETQAILPRLDFDLVEAMNAVIDGRLGALKLPVTSEACVSVVMASGGYPGTYANGKTIRGLQDAAKLGKVVVFHAGTKAVNGDIVTQGGRVLSVTALGKDIRAAVARAYEAVEKIRFDGAHYRKDIAARALSGKLHDREKQMIHPTPVRTMRRAIAAGAVLCAALAPAAFPQTSVPVATNAVISAPQPAPPVSGALSSDVEALIQILQTRYVNPSQVADAGMNRAAVQGIVASLKPGAELVTTNLPPNATPTNVPAVRSEIVAPLIGYVRMNSLDAAAVKEVDSALSKLDKEKIDSLVLDLRFTRGGTFADAAELASRFLLKDKKLFTVQSAQASNATSFSSTQPSAFIDWKLALLVNPETDGAAEAAAGALREQARGIITGGRSAGKAVVWSEETLPSGTKVRVATAKVVLASGTELFPNGIIPDVPIDSKADLERKLIFELSLGKQMREFVDEEQKEKRLNEAALVKMLSKGATNEPSDKTEDDSKPETTAKKQETAKAEKKTAPPMDITLQRAVDILKGIRVLHLE